MSGIKLIEDVVTKESWPVDEAVLWFVRDHVPAALTGFFAVVTFSGSARSLVPLAALAALAVLFARRRFEAVRLGASVITSMLVVWGMKAIVGRARPALWEAQWYWGSSFPSGHTLSTAALSTAAALCVARNWPPAATLAMALAVLWTGLVAVSRPVLGVHWPSDVLAGQRWWSGCSLPAWDLSGSSAPPTSHRRWTFLISGTAAGARLPGSWELGPLP